MSSRSLSVLLFAVALCFGSPMVQAQSSAQSLPVVEPIWQTLLTATSDLPSLIDSYTASWTAQISSLQASNEQLQTYVGSLEQQNVDLAISLLRSRADLVISEQEQSRSEKLLADSLLHITKAQSAARALELENAVLKYGMIGAGAVAVIAVIVAIVK